MQKDAAVHGALDTLTDFARWLDDQHLIVSPNPDRDPVARPGEDRRTHAELAADYLTSRP